MSKEFRHLFILEAIVILVSIHGGMGGIRGADGRAV